MSELNNKTNSNSFQKKEDQSIRSQYKFTAQQTQVKKLSNFDKIALKINGIAKLANFNKSNGTFNYLTSFVGSITDDNATLKDMTSLKKILYDKDDYTQENIHFEESKNDKSLNKTYKELDLRRLAMGDLIQQKWIEIENYVNGNAKEILDSAQNLKIIKLENDATDNFSEDCWKNLLNLSSKNSAQVIPIFVNNIKKENKDEEDNKKNVKKEEYVKNNSLSEEDKEFKKKLFNRFKNKRQEKNKEVISVIDSITENLKKTGELLKNLSANIGEDVIPNISDTDQSTWQKIKGLRPCNVETHLNNLFNAGVNAAKNAKFMENGMQLKFAYTLNAMSNKLNLVIEAINALFNSLTSLYSKDIEIAKGGGKTWNNVNKRIMFNYNLAKGNVNFIEKDKWEKLSHFEKIRNNFKFSDFNQMPDRRIWKKFSDKDKEEFLKLRNNFRTARIVEIGKIAEKDPGEAACALDKFIYYNWKDKLGYDCFTKKELKNKYEDNEEDSVVKNGLYANSVNLSKKKLLFNIFFIKGVRKFTNGRTIAEVVDFLKNKIKSSRKTKSFKNKFRFPNQFKFFSQFGNNVRKFNNYLGKKLRRAGDINNQAVDRNDQQQYMNLEENEENF